MIYDYGQGIETFRIRFSSQGLCNYNNAPLSFPCSSSTSITTYKRRRPPPTVTQFMCESRWMFVNKLTTNRLQRQQISAKTKARGIVLGTSTHINVTLNPAYSRQSKFTDTNISSLLQLQQPQHSFTRSSARGFIRSSPGSDVGLADGRDRLLPERGSARCFWQFQSTKAIRHVARLIPPGTVSSGPWLPRQMFGWKSNHVITFAHK